MYKKTVATTILCFLVLIFLVGTGATISAFGVAPKKVEVKSIKILANSGIIIRSEDGEEIDSLEIKSSSVGVRPATGEEDGKTSIPTTVNDQVGTEGAYGVFKLSSTKAWKIILSSCVLTNGGDENLENIRIAIMEDDAEAKSGIEVGKVLYSGDAVEDRCMVVVVWLDKDTTKSVEGADIIVELEIVEA